MKRREDGRAGKRENRSEGGKEGGKSEKDGWREVKRREGSQRRMGGGK